MSLDISFEYLNTIDDMSELNDIKKIIRLEKGQLSSLENQVTRAEHRLNSRIAAEKATIGYERLNNSS